MSKRSCDGLSDWMNHNVGIAWIVGCPGDKCCFDDFMILDLSRLEQIEQVKENKQNYSRQASSDTNDRVQTDKNQNSDLAGFNFFFKLEVIGFDVVANWTNFNKHTKDMYIQIHIVIPNTNSQLFLGAVDIKRL